MKYLLQEPTQKKTPQSKPIPGREKEMARNDAGGFAFKADSFARMERFLILGSEGGSYYCGEADLTSQNVDNLRACIAQDGQRAVKTIVDISVAGRAPKNDPAIYALALAASYGGDIKVRQAALAALPKVCRTGTHLFTFAAFVDTMRGWGQQLRSAIRDWYATMPPDKLAYQVVKYQQRNGWSHRDLLRLAHLRGNNSPLLRWITKNTLDAREIAASPKKHQIARAFGAVAGEYPRLIAAFEQAKTADEATVIRLIREHGLTREMIPTQHQKSAAVWEALLEKMPLDAMIRTLGRMSSAGLLAPFSDAGKLVVNRLRDAENLRRSRVHPIQCLTAMLTYKQGHGDKGKLTWTAVPQVVDALDDAFYSAFQFVPPTGKRFCIGVDVSGSMAGLYHQVVGTSGITPCMGAAAMAMLVARTESNYFIGGFSTHFVNLGITAKDRLDAAMAKAQMSNFGGTDCAVAINHALSTKMPVDCFVVITDGETWAGDTHACQAITNYRRKTGIEAKLVVINMVANRTKLTDPTDYGSLDIVGFDASVPTLIAGFLGADGEVRESDEAE